MRPENRYQRYHAHVYFDADSIEHARWLCHEAGRRFQIPVGDVLQRPVGPHPHWSCQLLFDTHTFAALIDWLDTHRDGLTILVHGDTGDDLADHTIHAAWLGQPATLDLSQFQALDRS